MKKGNMMMVANLIAVAVAVLLGASVLTDFSEVLSTDYRGISLFQAIIIVSLITLMLFILKVIFEYKTTSLDLLIKKLRNKGDMEYRRLKAISQIADSGKRWQEYIIFLEGKEVVLPIILMLGMKFCKLMLMLFWG